MRSPPCSLSFSSLIILPIIYIHIYIYIYSTTLRVLLTTTWFFLFYSVPSSRTFPTPPPHSTFLLFLIFIEQKLLPLFQKNYQTHIQLSSIYESHSIINPDLRTATTTQPNPLFFFLIFNASITTTILYKSQRSKEQQGCTTKEQWHEENRGDR